MLAATAAAEDEDCGRLPADQQAACWMVQACANIDEAQRRQDCFDAAARRFDDTADAANSADAASPATSPSPAEPSSVAETPNPAEPAAPVETAPPVAEASGEAADASIDAPAVVVEGEAVAEPPPVPVAVADPPQPQEPAVAAAIREEAPAAPPPQPTPATPARPSAIKSTPVERAVYDIPRRFSATVTAVRELMRDRHLVVLDDKLLFEGEQAARLAVGDSAEVIRASSLFGRRYRITGPSRRSFVANRIRCERLDLNATNQRKCDAMLGSQPR